MGFFDSVFDNMSWEQVCFRIPSKLAIDALKRRITNIDTLATFFDNCGTNTNGVDELKKHINTLISSYSVDDVLKKFEEEKHPILFGWLNDENKKRLKSGSSINYKLLFNIADAKDADALNNVLDKVLNAPELKQSEVSAIIHKSDISVFPQVINRVLRDSRPEVRCLVLSVGTEEKYKSLSSNTLMVGLKALAKSKEEKVRRTELLDFKLFAALKANERLPALKKYLSQFPTYMRVCPFRTEPTEDELDLVLFAGCVEENDLVVELKGLYNKILKEDKPEEAE